MTYRMWLNAVVLAWSVSRTPRLAACACCSEPDVWKRQTLTWAAFSGEGKFFADQRVKLDAGPLREQNGERDPVLKSAATGFSAQGVFQTGLATISFLFGGAAVDLIPNHVETFITDASALSDHKCGGGACLFKDVAVHGRLKRSDKGALPLGSGPWDAILILQGEGNNCANQDMKKWTLLFDVPVGNNTVPLVATGKILYR